ncbi:MAG: glycosyltransferase [Candidatus Omnitrophota bacterium]
MKKVLYLCRHLNYGGAEMGLLTTLKNIDRDKFNFVIVSIEKKGPVGALIGKLGFKVIYLDSKAGLFNIFLIWKITQILKEERPDILHTSLFYANFFGRCAALLARPRVVIIEERSMYTEKRFYHVVIDKILSVFTDKIIVCSNSVLDFTVRQEGIDRDKFCLIYNAVDTERFNISKPKEALRAEYGFSNDQFIIGTVGSLIPKKGHRFLIKAISELNEYIPGLKLLVIGEGESRGYLTELARLYKSQENVQFLGARMDVPELMKLLDIFALPSLQEGFPRTLIEAMYSGIPVVASNISGIPEVILDGENGCLVPPGDHAAMTDKIRILYKDPALRNSMGLKARDKIASGYLPGDYVKSLENLYTYLIDKKMKKGKNGRDCFVSAKIR